MITTLALRSALNLTAALIVLLMARARVPRVWIWSAFAAFLGAELYLDFSALRVLQGVLLAAILLIEQRFARDPGAGRGRFEVHAYFFLKKAFGVAWFFTLAYVFSALPSHGLNAYGVSFLGQCVAAFFLLDFTIYWVHRGQHVVPLWWKFHRVHHLTTEMTALAANRTHILEFTLVQLTLLLSVGAAAGLEPNAMFVGFMLPHFLIAELLAHANIAWPKRKTVWARIFDLPAVHALHHRIENDHANYGQILMIWDVLFGTFEEPPWDGASVVFGARDARSNGSLWREQMLLTDVPSESPGATPSESSYSKTRAPRLSN